MSINLFIFKAKEKLYFEYIKRVKNTPFYLFSFRAYWHYIFNKPKFSLETLIDKGYFNNVYYGARPNFFAGIGHQMANWISGLYWSQKLGLKHCHFPFSTKKWDDFLGFGYNEPTIQYLKRNKYKIRRLPQFTESDNKSIQLIKNIIASYANSKVVFWPPQDHFYFDQYGVMTDLQERFRNAPARKYDNLQYSKDFFNIAIHVRRTVIIDGKTIKEDETAKARRWLSNDYYEKVLKAVLETITPNKPISIWIFSTGKPEEFAEFKKYGDVHFCSNMNEYQSFAHLVFADLLITSKSSFSYKPALMNKGIKVCPRNFWHGYPNAEDWILCENDGSFDREKLKALFKK